MCGFSGPFLKKHQRLHAKCPKCGEAERVRLQALVLQLLLSNRVCDHQSVLHVAPENALRKQLDQTFGNYVSADLNRRDVDHRFDIQDIPFEDESFDLVFASHVLEYPDDDVRAIKEIRRILRPDGIAILPIPIIHEQTKDLAQRDPSTRLMHEPGLDYIERMAPYFSDVRVFSSDDFPSKHQLHVYEGARADKHPLSVGKGGAKIGCRFVPFRLLYMSRCRFPFRCLKSFKILIMALSF
ncbi:class I SAM-dependent methyltransferase [Congregibacter litoralis]|uniref:class I SAM-dependent methyltransferase n=1 Tax=Congregibacter litoralis TaxID=393662 RepID=UPI00006B9235